MWSQIARLELEAYNRTAFTRGPSKKIKEETEMKVPMTARQGTQVTRRVLGKQPLHPTEFEAQSKHQRIDHHKAHQ